MSEHPRDYSGARDAWPSPTDTLLDFLAPMELATAQPGDVETMVRVVATLWNAIVQADHHDRPMPLEGFVTSSALTSELHGVCLTFIARKRACFGPDDRTFEVEGIDWVDGQPRPRLR